MAEISCALEVLLYSGSVTDDLPLTLGHQGLTSYRQSQMSILSLSKHFSFSIFWLTEVVLTLNYKLELIAVNSMLYVRVLMVTSGGLEPTIFGLRGRLPCR